MTADNEALERLEPEPVSASPANAKRTSERTRSGVEHYRGVGLRYGVSLERLTPSLRKAFVRLHADTSTRAWIDAAFARPHGSWALAARAVARAVVSDYDANAVAGTHDMRVLGAAQLRTMLGHAGLRVGRSVIDVGAGDGHVTAELAELFDSVATTELSRGMARRLRARGYTCHSVDLAKEPYPDEAHFDAVLLLNVLDRTRHPISLLEAVPRLLRSPPLETAEMPWVLIALPLPLSPHVHVGAAVVDPEEMLPTPRLRGGSRESWEEAAVVLERDLLRNLGYRVRALARVPYLCRGGRKRPVTYLDDALFLCTAEGPLPSLLGESGS